MFTTLTVLKKMPQTEKPKLGEALAMLQAEEQLNLRPKIATHAESYLQELRKRREELRGKGSFFDLLDDFIRVHCSGDAKDVEQCRDFFIYLFLVEHGEKDCLELARKLNHSFHCFEIFSTVLRDYARTYEELSSQHGGVQ